VRLQLFYLILHANYMNLRVIPDHVDLRTQPRLVDQRHIDQPTKSTVTNTTHAQSTQAD
jgi:hypothetical protein